MQSNENWAASSIVLNHRSKTGTKKRGKHHYITYTQLKEKFGVHSRMIRDKKYAMEKERDPSDPSPAYWRKHPEVRRRGVLQLHARMLVSQDYELFLVWDSSELENTEEETNEMSFSHAAELTAQQTGAFMWLGYND